MQRQFLHIINLGAINSRWRMHFKKQHLTITVEIFLASHVRAELLAPFKSFHTRIINYFPALEESGWTQISLPLKHKCKLNIFFFFLTKQSPLVLQHEGNMATWRPVNQSGMIFFFFFLMDTDNILGYFIFYFSSLNKDAENAQPQKLE